MQVVLENIKTIKRLNENKLKLEFIKYFKTEKLTKCCDMIKENELDSKLYEDKYNIQAELIRNAKFIEYLKLLEVDEGLLIKINNLLEIVQKNNEKITDYAYDKIKIALENQNLTDQSHYEFIKYFDIRNKTENEQNIIAKNLTYLNQQYNIAASELTEVEKDLFILPYLSDYNLIPHENIRRVYELLNEDNYLKSIIHFFHNNKIDIALNLENYELIHKNSIEIYNLISELYNEIPYDIYTKMLERWIENKCSVYDLKIIKNKLKEVHEEDYIYKFQNRSSYINFIFGNKIANLELEMINEIKEKILIYAIVNNKRNFIKLIEDNSQTFFELNNNSLLFDERFYTKYFNINALTIKDLEELKTMTKGKSNIEWLDEKVYTFSEIQNLYNKPSQYFILYNNLLELKIDKRILILKQLLKKELLSEKYEESEIIKLAEKLKIKPLYKWLEKDFYNIKDLKVENLIKLLINYEDIERFISEITNEIELLYLIRNKDIIQKYETLGEIKENIEEIDTYWKQLVTVMDFNEDFISEHSKTIKEFLLNNGAELALTYYRNCENNKQKNSYRLIVKAQLMGEFHKLKYYTDDLQKEINQDLSQIQVKNWMANSKIDNGIIEVGEYDDFYSTMMLGVVPQRTCLSYKDGMYNRCLLACFDSNKKVLYAKINGRVVARAMIRLTKGKYNNEERTETSLAFIDLEDIPIDKPKVSTKEEYLTLFLERPYIAGITDKEEKQVKELFIKLLEKKATDMNAILVLSSRYSNIELENYVVTKYYMYISKSKAGCQYLDSLNGSAGISDEGQYKANNFLIWKLKEYNKSIKENIF